MNKNFFFTVDVEEWFASKLIKTTARERNEVSDFVEPMEFVINLLAIFDIKATFFFVYQTIEKYPGIFQKVVEEGHEVALHGEFHDNVLDLGQDKFRDMVRAMKNIFNEKFEINLLGYRAPHFGITNAGLKILGEEGFVYDSSMVPCLRIPGWYGNPNAPLVPYQDVSLKEFPVSVHPTFRLPGAGGYYFRNLGVNWSELVIISSLKRLGYALFYIHPWELSNYNPKNSGAPFYTFRKTGDWSRQNLKRLLSKVNKLKNTKCTTIGSTMKH